MMVGSMSYNACTGLVVHYPPLLFKTMCLCKQLPFGSGKPQYKTIASRIEGSGKPLLLCRLPV